jgi:hypothetical protein
MTPKPVKRFHRTLSLGNILDSGVVGDLAVASELSVVAEDISAEEMTIDFRGCWNFAWSMSGEKEHGLSYLQMF